MNNQVGMIWGVVAFVIIALTTVVGNIILHTYQVTGEYKCQGKAYDFYSCQSLGQMLRVTNATVWQRNNI